MVATHVRRAEMRDVARLSDIEATCFSNPWARDALEAELARSWARVLVAEIETDGDERRVVAFVNYWIIADELQVLNVATDPIHRRQGHARALLEALLAEARTHRASQVQLEVRASNAAAIALYASFGFLRVGERPRYYDDGEDAVLMTAMLQVAPPTHGEE